MKDIILNNKIEEGDIIIPRYKLHHLCPFRDKANSDKTLEIYFNLKKTKEIVSFYNGYPLVKENAENIIKNIEKCCFDRSLIIGLVKYINDDYAIIKLNENFIVQKNAKLRVACLNHPFNFEDPTFVMLYIDEKEDVDDIKFNRK